MSDYGSDDETERNSNVELGFLDDTASWKLKSRFFPSKVGGKPAWLALTEGIPSASDLTCTNCNHPLTFLCQLYSPIDNKEKCFHRSIYIFTCKTGSCIDISKIEFKVYRSQLTRTNKFYPADPPVEEETWRPDICAESFGVRLCNICGIRSTNRCGNCKTVYYCSKQHQTLDWKSGHKELCKGLETTSGSGSNYANLLFPEREIVTESESDIIEDYNDNNGDEIKKPLINKESLQTVDCDKDLEKMALTEEDKNFMKFRERIRYAPEQVVRYERNGLPMWITDDNVPSPEKDVPNCEYCGGRRVFEFQVWPQLLNYLGLNVSSASLDWGTLAVFTCANSCDVGPDYKLEYLYKQDIVTDTNS